MANSGTWALSPRRPSTSTPGAPNVFEREAKRRGITDPWAKAQLGKMTREGKAGDLTSEENRVEWRNRLTRQARREVAPGHCHVAGR